MSLQDVRLAVLAELARQSSGRFGRTAIMKLCYFLQTLKDVPLGYNYRLYTYGPYDSQVLSDLKTAETLGALRTSSFEWPGGSGYTIEPTDDTKSFSKRVENIVDPVHWVAKEFGAFNATELELSSTIIFVDRALHNSGEKASSNEIEARVHEIKPHHDRTSIRDELRRLADKRLLLSIKKTKQAA